MHLVAEFSEFYVRRNSDISRSKAIISVIMPCYNSAPIIEETITKLYQQTFRDFELIVVDDGSSDNSLQVLQNLAIQYSNLKIVSQHTKGPGPARNRGLKAATGEFIAFLDSDDSWHPEFLAKLYHKLVANPENVLAYCGWQNLGLNPEQCQPYIPPDYQENDKLAVLLRSCPWPIHAAITRKSAIEKVNGFNERWVTAEDFDMWIRVAMFSKIARVPEVLAYYHHQPLTENQISKNKLRTILNHWHVQNEFITDYPDIIKNLGKDKIDEITKGQLLNKAYDLYWTGDLIGAHHLFRKCFLIRYFDINDLKYIIPTILPARIFELIIKKLRG